MPTSCRLLYDRSITKVALKTSDLLQVARARQLRFARIVVTCETNQTLPHADAKGRDAYESIQRLAANDFVKFVALAFLIEQNEPSTRDGLLFLCLTDIQNSGNQPTLERF
jgi:hypothetical protein